MAVHVGSGPLSLDVNLFVPSGCRGQRTALNTTCGPFFTLSSIVAHSVHLTKMQIVRGFGQV